MFGTGRLQELKSKGRTLVGFNFRTGEQSNDILLWP